VVWLPCPYLDGDVELTAEREAHIRLDHSEVLPAFLNELRETVREPDTVLSRIEGERAFVRQWPQLLGGKGLMVVVVTDPVPSIPEARPRHWIVTAYIVRRLPRWKTEWART